MKTEKYRERAFDVFQWDGEENDLFATWGDPKRCVVCDQDHGHSGMKDGATINGEPAGTALFPCPGDYIVVSYIIQSFGKADISLQNYRPDAFHKIFEKCAT